MSFTRPVTLVDILRNINNDANQSAVVSTTEVVSQLASINEVMTLADTTGAGSVVVAHDTPGTWSDGVSLWGTDSWQT